MPYALTSVIGAVGVEGAMGVDDAMGVGQFHSSSRPWQSASPSHRQAAGMQGLG